MEVHVHLKNAFQAELETEGSRLATIFGLPPTPRRCTLSISDSFLRKSQFLSDVDSVQRHCFAKHRNRTQT